MVQPLDKGRVDSHIEINIEPPDFIPSMLFSLLSTTVCFNHI